MAGQDDLKIIIQSALDTSQKAIGDLNKQIDEIAKKLKKIDLNVDIDENLKKSISELSKNFSDLSQTSGNQAKIGNKVNSSLDKTTDSINKQTKAIKDATEAEKQWNLEQQKTSRITGRQTQIFGNNIDNSKQTRIGFTDGTVKDIIDTINPKKDLTDYNKMLDEAYKMNADFDKRAEELDRAHYMALKNDKSREEALDKAHYQALNENHKRYQKDLEQMFKQYEALDRSHFMAIQENNKRIEAMDKIHYLALEQNRKRDIEYQQQIADKQEKINDIRRRFGSDANVASGLDNLEARLKNIKNIGDIKKPLKDIETGLKAVIASADTATSHAVSMGEQFKIALTRFPLWMAASTLFFQSLHFFTEGIAHVNELNKSLTEISIVTGKTQDQVAALAKEYQNLGNQYHITSLELSKGAAELFRQGLAEDEVKNRMIEIAKFSKIASLDFKQSVELITASVNSMNISAQKATDTFAYLGDATATGADELAEGFQKMGGSVSALKIPFEFASSLLATLSSKTRESAATLGDSLKSLMARFQTLRETGFTEDGQGVNDVGKALDAVGVKLLDQAGNFRNYMDVITDLSKVFPTLTSRQQAYVSTALAGTFQQSRFLNVMQAMPDTLKLYTQSLNAAGTTNRKFDLYAESTAAHLDTLKNTMQGLWQGTFDSSTINKVIDLLNGLLIGISNLVDAVGPLPLLVGLVTTGMVLFTKNGLSPLYMWATKIPAAIRNVALSFDTLAAAEGVAGAATITLRNALVSLSTTVLPIAIITGVTFAISELIKHNQKLAQQQKEFIQQQKTIAENYTNQKDNINELLSEQEKLRQTLGKTAEADQRYLEISNELADLMPNLVASIDSKGQAHLKNADAIKKELDYARELSEQERNQKILDATSGFKEQLDNAKELQKEIEKIQKQIRTGNRYGAEGGIDAKQGQFTESELNKLQTRLIGLERQFATASGSIKNNIASIAEAMMGENVDSKLSEQILKVAQSLNTDGLSDEELTGKATAIASFFTNLNSLKTANSIQAATNLENNIVALGHSIGFTDEQIKSFIKELFEEVPKSASPATEATKDLNKELEKLAEQLKDTTSEIDKLGSAYDTLSKGESLSASTILELIGKYPVLARHLANTNDLTFEKGELIKEVANVQRLQLLQEVENEIRSNQNLYDSLEAKRKMYKQYFEAIGAFDPRKSFGSQVFSSEDQKVLDQLEGLNAQRDLLSKPIEFFFEAGKPKDNPKGQPELKDSLVDPLQDQDITKELLASYNALYESRQKNIESLDRQIKTAEKAKDEAKVIELTNKKIKEQTQSIEDLQSAQQKMHDLAESTRSDVVKLGKDIGLNLDPKKWFDSGGNATLNYVKVLDTLAERSQKVHDNAKLSVKERNKELDIIADQKTKIEEFFSILQLTGQEWNNNYQQIIKINDEIDQSKENLQQIKIEVDKAAYEKLRDAELKAIEKVAKAEDDRHQKRMDALEDEMNKYEESINKQKKELDRQFDTENFQDQLKKAQKEAQDIQNKINQYSLDNSVEGQAKKLELEKEYAEKQEEIAKLQKDRTKELRENSLDDMLDTKKKEVDAAKKTEDEEYKNNKEHLDNLKDLVSNAWEDIINDENTYLKTQAEVIDGHLSTIKQSIEKFFNSTSSISKGIGDLLLSGVTNAANGGGTPYGFSPIGKGSYVPTSASEQNTIQEMYNQSQKYGAASKAEKEAIYKRVQELGKSIGATYKSSEGVWYKSGLRLYHQGGEVGVGGTSQDSWLKKVLGLNSDEIPAILKHKEVVLSNPIAALSQITNRAMQNTLSLLTPRSPALAGGNTYNIDVHIDKVTGGQEGADQMWTAIKRGLKTGRYN
jgi:TP901 family phage tail tape measure protein